MLSCSSAAALSSCRPLGQCVSLLFSFLLFQLAMPSHPTRIYCRTQTWQPCLLLHMLQSRPLSLRYASRPRPHQSLPLLYPQFRRPSFLCSRPTHQHTLPLLSHRRILRQSLREGSQAGLLHLSCIAAMPRSRPSPRLPRSHRQNSPVWRRACCPLRRQKNVNRRRGRSAASGFLFVAHQSSSHSSLRTPAVGCHAVCCV